MMSHDVDRSTENCEECLVLARIPLVAFIASCWSWLVVGVDLLMESVYCHRAGSVEDRVGRCRGLADGVGCWSRLWSPIGSLIVIVPAPLKIRSVFGDRRKMLMVDVLRCVRECSCEQLTSE
jgi:hypothetical protein